MANLLQNISLLDSDDNWLKTMRKQGYDTFEKIGLPNAKTEDWKYTKLRELNAKDFVLSLPQANISSPEIELPFDSYKIYFENGIFNPSQSVLPQGVEVLPLIEVMLFHPQYHNLINSNIKLEKHPFAALNTAYLNEGIFIHIDSKVEIKKPFAIIYHSDSQDEKLFYNIHNIILLDDNASASVVEYHSYHGELKSCYLSNVVNEIYIGKAACLYHNKFQNEAFKASHVAFNNVNVSQDGRYESFCLQKGANIARNETRVLLNEKGAFAEVNAAYIMNGWATLDTTTNIEHLSAHTNSSQLVKGVVGGDAKGVFQGKIHIAPNAIGVEGTQLHKALLLSDAAEVDVKPELEIFADDVKCSHGAASGELDAEQLFYMCSRGIAEDDAKQLLIDAYLDDVISKIEDEKIAMWIKLFIK